MSFESNSWYGCNEIGLCNPVDTFFIGTDISYMSISERQFSPGGVRSIRPVTNHRQVRKSSGMKSVRLSLDQGVRISQQDIETGSNEARVNVIC